MAASPGGSRAYLPRYRPTDKNYPCNLCITSQLSECDIKSDIKTRRGTGPKVFRNGSGRAKARWLRLWPKKLTVQAIEKEWRDEWTTSANGKYLKKIDGGLPHMRALRLYGGLTRHETYLFTQLRSDHSWLSTYGKKRKFVDRDKCACGAVETVVHLLVDYPLLREARQELRRKVGDAFGSIATLLGGRNGQGQVNKGSSDRDVVKAVLEFADASERFKSRTSAVQSSGHSSFNEA